MANVCHAGDTDQICGTHWYKMGTNYKYMRHFQREECIQECVCTCWKVPLIGGTERYKIGTQNLVYFPKDEDCRNRYKIGTKWFITFSFLFTVPISTWMFIVYCIASMTHIISNPILRQKPFLFRLKIQTSYLKI